ncbi:antibiotic biosynthesis monooxygenase [Polaromonas sp. CT11-55]|uniref:antibiotic biosynthesis monooxygenase n=1 Tax=Polaromonas sp. CT11-55 TaxID=3243045 RepID=UPI0039A5EBD6
MNSANSTGDAAGPSSESVSLVVRHRVRAGARAAYDGWLAETMRTASAYPGHQGVHVVRPAGAGGDYLIVVRFATTGQLNGWYRSAERARLLETVQPLLQAGEQVSVGSGIDFLFPPEVASGVEAPVKPAAWKQWLITTSVIWPLTMVVPWAMGPLFKAVPVLGLYGVAHGILAAVIVALVVWVVMPPYTRLLHPWLFTRR